MPRRLDLTPQEKEQRKLDFARLRQQRFQAKKRAEKSEESAPSSDPIGDRLVDMLPAPLLDPNLLILDAKQLSFYASAPENTLADCAAALNVLPQSIEAFVLSNYKITWAEYKQQKERAAKAKAAAHLTAHAALGDLRSLEALATEDSKDPNRLSSEDWDAVAERRRLRQMSTAELQAEATRIRKVLEIGTEEHFKRLLAKSPTTIVVLEAAPLLPTTDDLDAALPSLPAEKDDIDLLDLDAVRPAIEQERPARTLPATHRSPDAAARRPELTVTSTPDNPARNEIELEPIPGPCVYTPPAPVGKEAPEVDGLAGLLNDLQRR
jgi:hypothetical protein